MSRARQIIFTLAGAAIVYFAALLLLEAGISLFGLDLKLFYGPPHERRIVPAADFEFEVQTNSLGLPGPEIPAARRETILLLGDSFAYGCCAPPGERFAETLEGLLRGAGREATVVNLSSPGLGAAAYRQRFELFARKFKPSSVVVALYVGNDFLFRPSGIERYVDRILGWLLTERSAAVGLQLIKNIGAAREGATGREAIQALLAAPPASVPDRKLLELAAAGLINGELILAAAQEPELYRNALLLETPRSREEFDAAARELALLARECNESNLPLTFLLIPDALQVETTNLEFLRGVGFRLDRPLLGTDAPQRRLGAAPGLETAAILSLLPAFRNTPPPHYHPRDIHWNGAAQQLAARELAAYLLTR